MQMKEKLNDRYDQLVAHLTMPLSEAGFFPSDDWVDEWMGDMRNILKLHGLSRSRYNRLTAKSTNKRRNRRAKG